MRVGNDGANFEVDARLAASRFLRIHRVQYFAFETNEITDVHGKREIDIAHLNEHRVPTGEELTVRERELVRSAK